MSDWKRNRLRVIRAEKRLTQHDVAHRLGISQASYSLLESAVREPDDDTRDRIAKALMVGVGELMEQQAS